MAGKINENAARNNYGCFATGAIRAERKAEYSKAAELWARALVFARSAGARFWATRRLEFCSNAVQRGWGLPDERAPV
ncbi:ANR family transcriptional regulator [Salmonella enterica]